MPTLSSIERIGLAFLDPALWCALAMIWLGVLLALGTSVSWAAGNVLTQRIGRRVGPPRAMLWSLAAGGILAAPCAAIFDSRPAPFTAAVAVWLAVAGVAGVIAYIGLFFAFANEGLTVAVPVVSSWPLVAGAISVGYLGERLQGRQWAGAAAVLAGVLLVALPAKRGAGNPRALAAAFGAAAGFGILIPALARIAPAAGAFGATVLVFATGIALAGVVARSARVSLAALPRAVWPLAFATGAAETTGFVTVSLARRFAPMVLVAPVASLASVFTVLYAWLFLKERPRPIAAAGALLAGAGVALLAS